MTTAKTPLIIFPTDLSRVGYNVAAGTGPESTPNIPYISFAAYKWAVDANQKKDASIFIRKHSRGTVYLPLSETVNDQQSINWETAEGIGTKNIGELISKTGIDAVRSNATFLSKFIEAKKGGTSNDLQSLAFGLTNFREWDFTFKLMPKGQRDSQRLAEVVQFFKQESIADFIGSVISYPSFFDVKVHFPTGESGRLYNKLLIFKAAVITSLGVNYLPDNTQSFYRDGAPTSLQLNITMKELERVNRSEYDLEGIS